MRVKVGVEGLGFRVNPSYTHTHSLTHTHTQAAAATAAGIYLTTYPRPVGLRGGRAFTLRVTGSSFAL